jgi:uncharacterized protein
MARPEEDGTTALMDACSEGDRSSVQSLVKAGVDVNERDWEGATALMEAAFRGDVDIVQILIGAGAEVNAQTEDIHPEYYGGLTPLIAAVKQGHKGVVKLLLDHRADINQTNSAGKTPLMYAVETHWTLGTGSVAMVGLLLSRGADPTIRDIYNETPAMAAASHGVHHLAQLIRQWRK